MTNVLKDPEWIVNNHVKNLKTVGNCVTVCFKKSVSLNDILIDLYNLSLCFKKPVKTFTSQEVIVEVKE